MEMGISPYKVAPFWELPADAFENMCRDIICGEPGVVTSKVFGTRGHTQYGIDIRAYLEPGQGVWFVQCKAYTSLKAEQIQDVTDKFIENIEHWKNKEGITKFILCVACDGSHPKIATAEEEQRKFFREQYAIAYELWSAETLQAKLRDKPGIVRQYCGPDWLERICGIPNDHVVQVVQDALDKALSEIREVRLRLNEKQPESSHTVDSLALLVARKTGQLAPLGEPSARPSVVDISNSRIIQLYFQNSNLIGKYSPDLHAKLKLLGSSPTLLVLGSAGIGKSILLFDLAKKQISEQIAIPAVLELGSYKGEPDLENWVLAALESQYRIPRMPLVSWINEPSACLILDGFDRLPVHVRTKLVLALNNFRKGRSISIVMASRITEYLAAEAKCNFDSAVYVKMLTKEQLRGSLEEQKSSLNRLVCLLEDGSVPLNDLKYNEQVSAICVLATRRAEPADYVRFRESLPADFFDSSNNTFRESTSDLVRYRFEAVAAFQELVEIDPQVESVARNPQLLEIIILELMDNPEIRWSTGEGAFEACIWSVFIKKAFTSDSNVYTARNMLAWMRWLSRSMMKGKSLSFSMDHLQPSILSNRILQCAYYLIVLLVSVLVAATCEIVVSHRSSIFPFVVGLCSMVLSPVIVLPTPMRVGSSFKNLYWSLGWLKRYFYQTRNYLLLISSEAGRKTWKFVALALLLCVVSLGVFGFVVPEIPPPANTFLWIEIFIPVITILEFAVALWLFIAMCFVIAIALYLVAPIIHAVNSIATSFIVLLLARGKENTRVSLSYQFRILITAITAVLTSIISVLICSFLSANARIITATGISILFLGGLLPIIQHFSLRLVILSDGGPLNIEGVLERACARRVLSKSLSNTYHFSSSLLREFLLVNQP